MRTLIMSCALVLFQAQAVAAENTPVITELNPEFSQTQHSVHEHEQSLRILYHREYADGLGINSQEKSLIEGYLKHQQLQPQWVELEEPWQLIPALLQGDGDIIISQGEHIGQGMQDQILLTSPWARSTLQVVGRGSGRVITSFEEIASHQVALKKSSPAWQLVEKLADKNPVMDLVVIPESMAETEIMHRVDSGLYELTILDSLYLEKVIPKYPDIYIMLDLSPTTQHAWAVAPDSKDLLKSLNEFLEKDFLSAKLANVSKEDLPGIKQRNNLRLITYQSPINLYYQDGELKGFEYELVNKFAEQHKLRVELVLANSHVQMQQLLIEGKGDVIAASIPKDSLQSDAITQTIAYHYSAPVLVGRDMETPLIDIQDLEGRRITLSPESPYRNLLEDIRKHHGIDFQLTEAAPNLNTEATVFMVAQGMYDLTVIPSHQLKPELQRQIGLQAHFPLVSPQSNVWAVRAEDDQLLAAINKFLNANYRNLNYELLVDKYIKAPQAHKGDSRLLSKIEKLSPYDETVQKIAEDHGFDWRLIVAQMYQESQFRPDAVSTVGATGLMQIMPETAVELGVEEVRDPEQSIIGGVKYLSTLRDSFEDDLLLEDRTWFSLAAYNAGYKRIQSARKAAAELGLDKDRWFGHVEKAMLSMSRPFKKDGETVRRCRCGQTVVYVREIRTLYSNYVRLTEAAQLLSSASSQSRNNDI